MDWEALATVVAFIALTQFWIAAAWRKYLRPGKIEFYESGKIEISFGSYGAHVALMDTVRAVHSDQFIRTFNAKVTRLSDSSTHKFDWQLSRLSDGSGNFRMLPALSFMVTQLQPIHINPILFDEGNRKIVEDLEAQFRDEYRNAWASLETEDGPTDDAERWKAAFVSATMEGSNGKRIVTSLERACFWEAGTYRLEFSIETDQVSKTLKKCWLFSISEFDAINLIGNAGKIARTSLDEGSEQFYFANVEFFEDSPPQG
jgi:hypothetical protein